MKLYAVLPGGRFKYLWLPAVLIFMSLSTVLAAYGLHGVSTPKVNVMVPPAAAPQTVLPVGEKASNAPTPADVTNVDVHASTNQQNSHTHTGVTVNGQSVPLPDNGSVHKSIPTNQGTTNVNISVDSHTSDSTTSHSSSSIQVNSNSEVESSSGGLE